jgi:lipoprotein-releasing system permease protein
LYKLLLCWRYLLTRYLALACIVSVMLGVATLIVVNSVMGGFSAKLKDRLHGLLSDVIVEAHSFEGVGNATGILERIDRDPMLHDKIEAMTPTLEIFAMLQFKYNGTQITRPVRLIGIDPIGRTRVRGFAEHLVFQKDQLRPSFDLTPQAKERYEFFHPPVLFDPALEPAPPKPGQPPAPEPPPPEPPPPSIKLPEGIIVGFAIASFREAKVKADTATKDVILLEPGDDVIITTIRGTGDVIKAVQDRFVVCDYFKSEMSEYDANYVFVPLNYLQFLRSMEDRVTSILIRLKNYDDAKVVVDQLKALLAPWGVSVLTWQDKQGPLLAAIVVEKGLLNILLFLIIGVAGFGILAIFTMIVAEKTRDIGILKALGASNAGVMSIFLGYGILLGVIGACLGTVLGVSLTVNINGIEQALTKLTGWDIFPRDVYYFDKIPFVIQPLGIALINAGAVGIAVLSSVLPALRAALLHPVRALRYE